MFGRLRPIGNLSACTSPGVTRALILLLLLLLLLRWRRVRLLYYVLPFRRCVERGADGRRKFNEGVCHGRLQQLRGQLLTEVSTRNTRIRAYITYDVILVVGHHLVDVAVHQGLQAITLPADTELGLSSTLQGQGRKEDILGEGQDSVVFGLLGCGLGFADLLPDTVFRLKKVDFAI